MRWFHYDPLCVEEVEHRAEMTARFDRFWHDFAERVSVLENALDGGTAWDWHRWLDDLLASVDGRWHWEMIPDTRDDRWSMAIAAPTDRATRPMLRDFLAAAPQIPGWSFSQWLPPMPYSLARRWARERSSCDCDHLAVKIHEGTAGRIDLEFLQSPDAQPATAESWLATAFAASEAVLGGQQFDELIGSVTLGQPNRDRGWWRRQRASVEGLISVEQLAAAASERLASWREQLPPAPLAKLIGTRGWTTVEVEPANNVPDTRGHDLRLLTGSVVALPMLQVAHEDRRFQSSSHSRFGETFCYVQWEHDTATDDDLLSRREVVDGVIAGALKQSQAGCVIGGGIGEKYLYFDVALTNSEQAIRLIRQSLLSHDPPPAAWLRFHDAELADEWIGIHPEADAPRSK